MADGASHANAVHRIAASPTTVQRGIIDPQAAFIAQVRSGDTILLDTMTMWNGAVGADLDVATALSLRDQGKAAGRGPHSLTGPIAVEGAKPGDTLRIDIERLDVADHGINMIFPGAQSRALLPDLFPDAELRHFVLDRRTMTTQLCEGVTIPLRPFLGIMGVLPADGPPRSSAIPGPFGGNIDCPDLVEGSTIFLPVFVAGGGFYVGDAHAAQGCGEVVQTALETSIEAQLRVTIVDGPAIGRPRAETRDHLITMGFSVDLREAARQAVTDMITLLVETRGMKPSDAYALCSLQADLLVTQIVNGENGIHVRVPKAIFTGGAP